MTDDLLACGRDPLQVWDDAAGDHIGSHEQVCAYCQVVISEQQLLAGPVRRWQTQVIEAPATLLERVMTIVRAALRARSYLPLVSPYGPVRLDTATATAVLRWVVDQLDDARARTCRIEPVDLTPAGRPGEPPPPPIVALTLSLTARLGAPPSVPPPPSPTPAS